MLWIFPSDWKVHARGHRASSIWWRAEHDYAHFARNEIKRWQLWRAWSNSRLIRWFFYQRKGHSKTIPGFWKEQYSLYFSCVQSMIKWDDSPIPRSHSHKVQAVIIHLKEIQSLLPLFREPGRPSDIHGLIPLSEARGFHPTICVYNVHAKPWRQHPIVPWWNISSQSWLVGISQ